jgi:branched-subunit amino acid ABC-type transport system permease component
VTFDFLVLAIASFAIDGIVWGVAGYCVFRLLGGRRWWVGILATIALSLAQQALVFVPLVHRLDLRIGDETAADLIGTDRVADLITFDPFSDVAVAAIAIVVGFLVAGGLDERRARRAAMAPSRDAR